MATITLPDGYDVVKQEYEVPCDHYACDTIHRHLYNENYPERTMVTLYNLKGDEVGVRWETRYHMTTRREWVILLNGVRVGDVHDTRKDAVAEAMRRPTI